MTVSYICEKGEDPTCPEKCQSLEECAACSCVVAGEGGGPWGDAMDVILCFLPIIFLLYATLKKKPFPTTVSLPFAAFMLFMIRVMYLGSDPLLVSASVISGLHEALTPLAIMCGAIFLFETMESTLCMPYMLREMKMLSKGHPVAETMLLFSFAYMVEGAAGFGTPAALGAPMLASLGYSKLDAVVLLLMFNTFATVWGSVGTPIWFGFGPLGLSEDDYIDISYKAGVCLFIAGFLLLPTVALRVVCPWHVLQSNLVFIFLSFLSCAGLSLALSFVSYEFSSLVGGIVGCFATALLIAFNVGLKPYTPPSTEDHDDDKATKDIENGDKAEEPAMEQRPPSDNSEEEDAVGSSTQEGRSSEEEEEETSHADRHTTAEALLGPRKTQAYLLETAGRTFPLWGTVVLLMLTRIDQIGLKEIINRTEPSFSIDFGSYGTFRMSSAFVLELQNIMSYPNINWKFALLYVPFLLPFIFISLLTMVYHRFDLQCKPTAIAAKTMGRLRNPAIALLGALTLVKLLLNGGTASPAYLIGTNLSDALQQGWVVVACFLGMLGSFFSGSTTVSNLTFGGIQLIAAQNLGVNPTALLALQAAGGSAGNGICLNNIIAASAVVGLNVGEGQVIARTGPLVLAFCSIATVVSMAFFIRFD